MTNGRKRTRPRTLDHEPEAVTWARKKAGLTKRALADLIGISEQLMNEIESGWRNATPANLARIAEAVNCPVVVLERRRPRQPSPFAQADTTTTSNNRGGIPVAGNALPASAGRTWAISTTTGYTTSGHLPAWADDDPSTTGVAPERLGTELTDVLHCTTFGGQLLRACPQALDPGEDSVALTAYLQCAPYAEEPERRVPLLNLQLAGDLWLTNLDPQDALEVAEQLEDFVTVLREKAVPAAMAARTEWAARQPRGAHGRQAGGAPDTAGPALLTEGGAGPEWATPPGTRG